MTIQDPRILINLLNDLIEELRYWKITARETLDQMSWHQRQSEEKVSQALYHASIIQDQAKNDQKLVIAEHILQSPRLWYHIPQGGDIGL